jgi:hypothetical protein
VTNDDVTRFLNVDLDISSKVSLEPLVAAFGKKVFVHHVGKVGRTFWARMSRTSYGHSADRLTRELCGLIVALPSGPMKLWRGATSREFNVGIQAGLSPHCHEVRLSKKTVALVAQVGGTIALTTYAPEVAPDPRLAVRTRASVPSNNQMHLRGPRRRGGAALAGDLGVRPTR